MLAAYQQMCSRAAYDATPSQPHAAPHTAASSCCPFRRWFTPGCVMEGSYLPKALLRDLEAVAQLAGHGSQWRTSHFLGRQMVKPPEHWIDAAMPGDNHTRLHLGAPFSSYYTNYEWRGTMLPCQQHSLCTPWSATALHLVYMLQVLVLL